MVCGLVFRREKRNFAVQTEKTSHYHDRTTSTYSSRHHRIRDSIHHHLAGAECQCEEDYHHQYEVSGEPEHLA